MPFFFSIFFYYTPPSEANQNPPSNIFHGPEIKCAKWNDKNVTYHFVAWEKAEENVD